MAEKNSFHSICAWTFNAGKGGFTPADMRPDWAPGKLGTVEKIKLVKDRIAPLLPENVQLGWEMHYDYEYDEKNAAEIADALVDAGVFLAMATPGAHQHWAYGGPSSLDSDEMVASREFSQAAVELVYGPLKKAWHPDAGKAPCLVIWNGSFGYDLASAGLRQMYENLKESIASLCDFEKEKGGELYMGIEPKPNEGHPAMLLPTVASVIVFWRKLEEQYGISREKKGVNKEFGHSEMVGLDIVYDTVEELDNNAMVHMHLNSQGYSDGLTLGGPGKFDIDHGVGINAINLAVAGMILQAGYGRWKGHDMQPRPYDSEEQALDRVVRSILSWEACERTAGEFDYESLMELLSSRKTAAARDLIAGAVQEAESEFRRLYVSG